MPALAAIIYLLLALRVRIGLNASLSGAKGSVMLTAGAAGLFFRFDGEILHTRKGLLFTIRPRYSSASKRPEGKEKKSLRLAKSFLRLARMGRMECLALHARIGLDDAAQTAIAAGCVRAAASALFTAFDSEAAQELHVMPDFDEAGFCAQLRCIFSCQLGDIMLAAMRAAFKKAGERDWVGKASH